MSSPNVDTRKLKDQASEFLGKSRFDKAAEILEQLVRVEPKEMQHRLKLGDSYRRLGANEKAISCYQIAGRFFADAGQLIKAIGAFKVIVELDPKNEAAQKDLAQMNQRRFAKPTLESVGLKVPKAIGAGARAVSELELAEGEKAAEGVGAMLEGGRNAVEFDAAGDDEAPLELDLPSNRGKPAPASAPKRAPVAPPEPRRGPPPKIRPSIVLGGGHEEFGPLDTERVNGPEPELELDPEVEPEIEPLDKDLPAPVEVSLATPASAWRSGPLGPKPPPSIPVKPAPAAAAKPAPAAARPAPSARPEPAPVKPPTAPAARAPQPAPPEEIELDPIFPPPPARAPQAAPGAAAALIPAPPPARPGSSSQTSSSGIAAGATASASGRGAARPIADLLGSANEEEIELISISSDGPEAEPPQPAPTASGEELDAAFDAIAPEPKPEPKPVMRRPAVPLFDDLPQQAFVELVNRLTYKRYAPGEIILREGDPGRSFFVIVEGKVRVYKKLADGAEITLATLGEGAFFGEMALLSGAPRTAHIAAEEETQLLEISDAVLREVVARFPSVAQSLKNFYRARLVNNVMAISPMFKEFAPAERRGIVERFRMKQVLPGEVLIREGQQSDGLYVVLHGAVRVAKKAADGSEVELARLKEGELFGEMSLLTSEPASATVSAAGPCILLKLPGEQFQELILTHPQIL